MREGIRIYMPQIYQYQLTIPDYAIDVNGHVSNIEYLRWMQEAAVSHMDIQGCTKATIDSGATWVVRMHHIKYLRPAFGEEKIIVLTWVSNLNRFQSLRKYRIIRTNDNTVLVKGETEWVFVDAKTGRLRSIPKDVINKMEILSKENELGILSNLKII